VRAENKSAEGHEREIIPAFAVQITIQMKRAQTQNVNVNTISAAVTCVLLKIIYSFCRETHSVRLHAIELLA